MFLVSKLVFEPSFILYLHIFLVSVSQTLQILTGLASFFVVSIGGTLLGLLWGLATAFVTKYTDHVRGK